MSDINMCSLQDDCPLLIAALDSKVKTEAEARLTASRLSRMMAEYEAKKPAMNELYAAGVVMRKAQCEYFKLRTQDSLQKSKAAEARFDRALESCRNIGKPVQLTLI